MKIDLSWFSFIIIATSLVISFTFFKIASCKPFKEKGEKFSWQKLWKGCGSHFLVIIGMTITYLTTSIFGSELILVNINGTDLTMPSALNVAMLGVIAYYCVKLIKTFCEYAGVGNMFNIGCISGSSECNSVCSGNCCHPVKIEINCDNCRCSKEIETSCGSSCSCGSQYVVTPADVMQNIICANNEDAEDGGIG